MRKRPRLSTEDLTADQIYPLFATREEGLAIQPGLQPILFANEPCLAGTGGSVIDKQNAPKTYQVFHCYSDTGENPLRVEWSKSYDQIAGIRINRITLAVSFLLFEDDQTILYQPESSGSVNFIIPAGNYAYSELRDWFGRESGISLRLAKTQAGQAVLHLRDVNGPCRFALSFANAMQLRTALGFEQTIFNYEDCALYTVSRVNGVSVNAYSLTGSRLINLSLPPFIYLQGSNSCVNLTSDGIETSGKFSNILATIPITGTTGSIINWSNPRSDFYDSSTSREYLFDQFTFLSPSGSILSFNAPFDIEIGANLLIPYSGSMISRFNPQTSLTAVDYNRSLFPTNDTAYPDADMYYEPPVVLPNEEPLPEDPPETEDDALKGTENQPPE